MKNEIKLDNKMTVLELTSCYNKKQWLTSEVLPQKIEIYPR